MSISAKGIVDELIRTGHAELRREQPHSIELTRNVKGEYSWSLKAYYAQGEAHLALDALHSIDLALRDLYIVSKGASDA